MDARRKTRIFLSCTAFRLSPLMGYTNYLFDSFVYSVFALLLNFNRSTWNLEQTHVTGTIVYDFVSMALTSTKVERSIERYVFFGHLFDSRLPDKRVLAIHFNQRSIRYSNQLRCSISSNEFASLRNGHIKSFSEFRASWYFKYRTTSLHR